MKEKAAKLIHEVFDTGIFLKGLNGVLEIIGGVMLIFIHPKTINNWVIQFNQKIAKSKE